MSNNQAVELMVEGRLVGGHPMDQRVVMDDRTNQPKLQADCVTPRTEAYIGIAIPKGNETHWNQTVWGRQMQEVAIRDWPNGEHGGGTFAWKVMDGDSQVPNTKGKKPCEREGYPGHWVINASTGLAIKCYHVGKYDPLEQIQDKNMIKAGDYCRVLINVRGNGPSQSPGIYMNPQLFELSRPGQQIILDGGPSAADAFGGGAPAQTQAAAPASAPATPGNVEPAPDFVNGPAAILYTDSNGGQFTREQLQAAGYTDTMIDALPHT